MAPPATGTPAPDFVATTDEGTVSLTSLRGGPVVLYFYPKDATPGCTIEAREFALAAERFAAAGVRIFGVSKDSVKSHQKFRAKECLPFPLIADEGAICEAYGAWRKKKLYGREYDGIARITVLIDANGSVARVWDPVTARGHAAEVLAYVEGAAG